jgi:hypothetical protein
MGFISEIRSLDGGHFFLIGSSTALFLILPVLHLHAARPRPKNLEAKWNNLISTLSGDAVAYLIFENNSWIISFVPLWLIVADCYMGLAALFLLVQNVEGRENRKNVFFFLLIGFLIFVQIVITPQAGGPHDYSMIFPLPLLAFVFLAPPLYRQVATKTLRRFAALSSRFRGSLCLRRKPS